MTLLEAAARRKTRANSAVQHLRRLLAAADAELAAASAEHRTLKAQADAE